MATVKCAVPNWGQAQLARAVNLDPNNLVVSHEDDRNISFLQHNPRKQILVNKITGQVIES